MSDKIKSNDLFEKMMYLQWLLHRRHLQSRSGHGPFADPTRGQGRVLAILKLQPEISTRDLSYLLDIRQQSLSELLSKLEKSGYITRTPMESDKRVMMITLTDKGKAVPQERPDFSDLFDCLTPEEQDTFGGYLDRIIQTFAGEPETDSSEDMMRWMEQARSRMGDEAFEHLMAMRGKRFAMGGHGHGRPHGGRGGCGFHQRRHGRPGDPCRE